MVEAFGISDPGSRGNNEDYYLLLPEKGLYVVADGMGGAQAGEHASRLAAESVADFIRAREENDAETLTQAFERANQIVMHAATNDISLDGMGTTLVAALDRGEEIYIASVGDSRAYVHQNGRLIVITEDQTWVHEVGRRLGIDEQSLKVHPMRHVLTMAIGVSDDLRVHSYALVPGPGIQVLLCSDGLHGVVEPESIAAILSLPATLQEKGQHLIDAAKKNGAPDNITAVLLACH